MCDETPLAADALDAGRISSKEVNARTKEANARLKELRKEARQLGVKVK